MNATLRITVLGCGASQGVPRVSGDWGACDPSEARNLRTRCSILMERVGYRGATRLLVDTGPDVRNQLIAANVKSLDAVVYTHGHADHVHGIDDLRVFWQNTRKLIDVYADEATNTRLVQAFGYCFEAEPGSAYSPIMRRHPLRPGEPLIIDGAGGPLSVTPFRQIHGDIDSIGLRGGDFAYSCDLSDLPGETVDVLAGLDVWLVDALRYDLHPSHFNVREATQWIGRLLPRRAILTHMHADLDYGTLKRDLPSGIEPAHDGMVFELPLI